MTSWGIRMYEASGTPKISALRNEDTWSGPNAPLVMVCASSMETPRGEKFSST